MARWSSGPEVTMLLSVSMKHSTVKEEGYEGEIDVPPEKAFGNHDPKRVESFPKNQFKEKPVKGMTVKVEELGEGVVLDIIGRRVIVDFNHPFAGKTLHYQFKIESKVEDLIEKVKDLSIFMQVGIWRSLLKTARLPLPFPRVSIMTGDGYYGGAG